MRTASGGTGRRRLPAAGVILGVALMSGMLVPTAASAGSVVVGAAAAADVDPGRIVARLADAETRAEAGAELLLWIRELAPERASLWLRLAVAMDRLPPDHVGAAARAVLRCDPSVEGAASARLAAARGLRDETLALPAGEQPVLLALAAHLLELEAPGEALALRRRYLAGGFDGPEAAEVVLSVARALLDPPGAVGGSAGVVEETPADEARRILEDFLEGAPEHPMAPEARRLRALAVRAGGGAP